MRNMRSRLVGLFGGGAGFVLVLGLTAYACTNLATLNLSNTTGRPGDTITLTGSSFITVCVCGPQMPPTPVKIRWGGTQGRVMAELTPDRAGTLATSFTVPDVSPGYYVIAATQRDETMNIDSAGTPALTTFEVLTPAGQSVVPPSEFAATNAPSDQTATSSGLIALTVGLGVLGFALFVAGSAAVIRQVATRKARVPSAVRES